MRTQFDITGESRDRFAPGKLWSLWDMLEIHAKSLLAVMATISEIRGSLMMVSRAPPYPMPDGRMMPSRYALGRTDYEAYKTQIASLPDELEAIGLTTSAEFARTLLHQYSSAKDIEFPGREIMGWDQHILFEKSLERVIETIPTEIGSSFALIMPKEGADLYSGKRSMFAGQIGDKFPSLQFEMSEADKCFALGRHTAATFHAIRCLEGGIRAISRCLNIPDPTKGSQRSWHNLLKAIQGKMQEKWPDSADRFDGDGRLFEDLYASLSGMQNPWRNATMHLDQKYTDEEARHIIGVVSGFLRKLASRCDEEGSPRA